MLQAAGALTALSELIAADASGDIEHQHYAVDLCACADQLRECACRQGAVDTNWFGQQGVDHCAELTEWLADRR